VTSEIVTRSFVPAAAAWTALLAGFAALALGLPADTFFVGDPGVKLIAARQALSDRPLEVPLPTIGGETAPYVEPFFAVHGDHAHVVTSELFPLVSAPFLWLFGGRGVYVLPALGFFLSLAATAKLAARIVPEVPAPAVAAFAAFGTPWLFYGLEFWEHMPSVGAATLATHWFLGAPTDADFRGRTLLAGALYGVAVLLRPEAIWFFVAVAAASRMLPAPPSAASVASASLGAFLVVLPLVIYSALHFGTLIPPHIGSHSELLTREWLRMRTDIASRWFLPGAPAAGEIWGVALLGCLALGWISPRSRRGGSAFLATVGLIDVALVLLTAPNDGGGQWSPRYLLFAFVPAAILAAAWVARPRRAGLVGATAAVVFLAGAWAQREGYRELRGAKLTYGRVLEFVRHEVPAGGWAVTDVWWLDQVAAAATDERHILFAASPDAGREAVQRLARAGTPSFTFIGSRQESPGEPAWLDRTCYREETRREIPERTLVATRYRLDCR
jgi:hypothetical protein